MEIFMAKKILSQNLTLVEPKILQEAVEKILSEIDLLEEKIISLEKKNVELEEEILKLRKNFYCLEDLPGEIWRDVSKRFGLYQVSNLGRIKSFCHKYPKILKQKMDTNGY